jgi:hypothetical protein
MPLAGEGQNLICPIQSRVDPETNRRIDAWRRRQEKIPGLAEALRQLVAKGLESEHA